MMKTNYIYTIMNLRPGASFGWEGEETDGYEELKIHWNDEMYIQPTKEECDAAWKNGLRNKFLNQEIREKRAREYPPIGDQLDAIYKAMRKLSSELRANGQIMPKRADDWMLKITKVKEDNPLHEI